MGTALDIPSESMDKEISSLRFEPLLEPELVQVFLDLLPQEWREILELWMKEHPSEPELYGIFGGENLLAGGAVFRSSLPPGTNHYINECLTRFAAGQAYIGFLWVSPESRGLGVGHFWLQSVLKEEKPSSRAFWLTIEDPSLVGFYSKAGFKLIKELKGEEGPEWLLSTNG